MTACLGNSWQGNYNYLTNSCDTLNLTEPDDDTTDVVVYNEDGTCRTLNIAEGLRTCDLCELLTVKNHVTKDCTWSLVERWQNPAIERTVEDHEDVLTTYRSMRSAHSSSTLCFRRDFAKYEFFHNPQRFFPDAMIELPNGRNSGNSLERIIALQNLLTTSPETPQVFGWLWLAGPQVRVWRRAYFWLLDHVLYYSMESADEVPVRDPDKFAAFARLENCTIYGSSDARRDFKAPCEEAVVLRSGSQLTCLACDNSASRRCWQTALRIAKYGRQLFDSYNLQRIQQETELHGSSPRDRCCSYSSGAKTGSLTSLSSLSAAGRPRTRSDAASSMSRPRRRASLQPADCPAQPPTGTNGSTTTLVAMDFTGGCGRVVTDPLEAKAIELAEGHHFRRADALRRLSELAMGKGRAVDVGIHSTQPWFHGSISRDEAASLLNKYKTREGVFLLRQCNSNPAAFVLSFMHAGKLYHAQIMPMRDASHSPVSCYFSLDGGKTRFYDLLQLVEFYQLNAGVLPTRLMYFVTRASRSSPELRHVAQSF